MRLVRRRNSQRMFKHLGDARALLASEPALDGRLPGVNLEALSCSAVASASNSGASPATISRRTCSARLPRPRADHDHARYRRGRSCRGSSPMSKQTNVGSARRRSRRQDRPEGRRGNSICGSMGRREAPSGHDLWVGATRAPECFCGSMGLYRRTFRLSV
jgi:hypothetical protein